MRKAMICLAAFAVVLGSQGALAEASGTPISAPYSIEPIVELKIWEVGKPIPVDVRCRVQDGKQAQLAVACTAWVKVAAESSVEDVEVTLDKTKLEAGASTHAKVAGSILLKHSGEFILNYTISDEAGVVRGMQSLFVIARDGKVAISGSDFRICEWQFLMTRYGLALDTMVDELPVKLKMAVRNEYKTIRRDRTVKETQYDQQNTEQNTSQTTSSTSNTTSSTSNTKSGTTTFMAFWTASNGKRLSIVGAKVQVLDFSTKTVLEQGYLKLSGEYSDNLDAGGVFEFNTPAVDYEVWLIPEYNGALVGGQVVGSYDSFEVVDVMGESYDADFFSAKNAAEYTAPQSTGNEVDDARRSGVWGVYHGVLDIAKSAKDLHGLDKGSSFSVEFPSVRSPIDQDNGAFYSRASKNVFIGWNSRNGWDTLAHEYSHLIDDEYNIVDSSPGGGHYINQNAYLATADRQKTSNNKDASLRLAMSEAYATWFGTSLTLLSPYKDVIGTAGTPFGVGDTNYTGGVKFTYSLEDGPSGKYNTRGEDSELAIQRLMWDWCDDANNESRTVSGIEVRDRLTLGHADLLNSMKNKSLEGIYQLWRHKFLPGGDVSKFNQQAADAAEGLVFFGLGPVLTDPPQNTELDLSATNPDVTFKWVEKDDTGHSDMDFDEYKLVLYNSDYSKVLFERPWSTHKEYKLVKNDLRTIQNALGGSLSDVKAAVFGKDTLSPETGPYASNVIDLKTQGVNRWVVMVVDSSGSNGWTDPSDWRKTAAKEMIRRLLSVAEAQAQSTVPDRAASIDFDDYPTVLSGFDDPPVVEPTIDSVDSSGGTDIAAGIDSAATLLENAQVNGLSAFISGKAVICVFTDGENSAGPIPVIWSITAAIAKGIRVHYGILNPQIKGGVPDDSTGVKGGGGVHKGDPPYATIEEAVLASGGVYGQIRDDVSQLAFVDQMYRAGLTQGDPAQEGLIVGQVEIAGRLPDARQDVNYYFNGQQNEDVTITVTGLDFDPEIYLVDRNGQFIASDKNYEGDPVAEIVTVLPYTGMYNVKIFAKGGETGRFNIFVDVENPGSGIIEDVTQHTTVSFSNWTLDRSTGALIGTMVLRNNTGSPKTLKDAFWYAVPASANVFLAAPEGATPDGVPYLDITAEVVAALPNVGNGDLNLDPGEEVTIGGIAVYSRDRSLPQSYVFALWADPPAGATPRRHITDKDGNGVIDDFEVLEVVDLWNGGEFNDFGLLEAIEFWRAGGYEW
ncbi:MAG: VWA domain-containing protein, partial [Verrucomicrobiota bacterium]|nr:VWA domain-containing protein [Verrucomicrobiota bacterium]